MTSFHPRRRRLLSSKAKTVLVGVICVGISIFAANFLYNFSNDAFGAYTCTLNNGNDCSTGGKRGISQFDFNIENIRWNSELSTVNINNYNNDAYAAKKAIKEHNISVQKSAGAVSNLWWTPLDQEYAVGYIDLATENDEHQHICSSDIEAATNTGTSKNSSGSRCNFPTSAQEKSTFNYVDHQNAAHRDGLMYDIREYVWFAQAEHRSASGCKLGVQLKKHTEGSQDRWAGAVFGDDDCGKAITIVEYHFYPSGTLFYGEGDNAGQHKPASELPQRLLNQKENEVGTFKATARFDDIDSSSSNKNNEGYIILKGAKSDQNGGKVWVTKNTLIRLTNTNASSNPYSSYGNFSVTNLPWPCTNTYSEDCARWAGSGDQTGADSWKNDRSAIWVEFESSNSSPFTIAYTSRGHASSITSKLAIVNYIIVGDIPSEIQGEIDATKAKEEKIKYRTTSSFIEGRTIKRFGVTSYAWYNVDTYSPQVPSECIVNGWYTNEGLTSRVSGNQILMMDSGDAGWNSGWNGYFYYGEVFCGLYITRTSSSLSGSIAYSGETINADFNVNIYPDPKKPGSPGNLLPGSTIQYVSFIVDKNTSLDSVKTYLKGTKNYEDGKDSASEEYSRNDGDVCGYIGRMGSNIVSCNTLGSTSYEYNSDGSRINAGTNPTWEQKNYPVSVPDLSDADIGRKICVAVGIKSANTDEVDKWNISGASCRPIAKKPNIQVWNGGLYTSGEINTSVSNKSAGIFGSWSEYYAIAGGQINGFASASGLGYGLNFSSSGAKLSSICDRSRLTISNNACSSGSLGNSGIQNPSAVSFAQQIINRYSGAANNSALSGDSLNNKLVNLAGTRVIKYNGTLHINNNICITSGCASANDGALYLSRDSSAVPFSDASIQSIPQVIIIADNIEISENVTQIDAWLITDPSKNGYINTCAGFSASTGTDHCGRTLKINGPVFTSKILLNRTAGAHNGTRGGSNAINVNLADYGSITPAEIFDLHPLTAIWAYSQESRLSKAYVSFMQEMAPRF